MKRFGRRPPSLLGFLLGSVILRGRAEDAPTLISACMRLGLSYRELRLTDGGGMRITLTYRSAHCLLAAAERLGIVLEVEHREGICEALSALLKRPGLIVGALLAVLFVSVASTRLWEIRVVGNVTVSEGAVIRELREAGLSLGDRVPSIDVDSIENRLLMHSERISWISVNLVGTVAEVQIREKLPRPEESDTTPANLVAARDGVVVACEVEEGNTLVKVGTPVRRGEVLVSGLYDSSVLGYRYTRARGRIYAETEREFRIEVPYLYTRASEPTVVGTRRTLVFFGREQTVLSRGDCTEDEGQTRVTEHTAWTVLGRTLPIAVRTETFYTETTETDVYSVERAMEIAYYRLASELRAIEGLDSLVEKSTVAEITDDAYVLLCRVRCIENIAETKPIEIARE